MAYEKSKLQIAIEAFDDAVERVREARCGNGCFASRKCENAGTCIKALIDANNFSERYLRVHDDVVELSGAIPEEYVKRFVSDSDYCLSVLGEMNQRDNSVRNIAQLIALRRNLVRRFDSY